MKADISDAPGRVTRGPRRPGVFFSLSVLVIGGIATVGALQLMGQAPSLDTGYKRSANIGGREEEVLIGGVEALRKPDIEPPQLQPASGIRLPADTARQTVFNDQNFTPRGANNVVDLHVGSDPFPRKDPEKKVKLTIVQQSRSMKDRACWPYRQGSVESRNCRASIGLRHRD